MYHLLKNHCPWWYEVAVRFVDALFIKYEVAVRFVDALFINFWHNSSDIKSWKYPTSGSTCSLSYLKGPISKYGLLWCMKWHLQSERQKYGITVRGHP